MSDTETPAPVMDPGPASAPIAAAPIAAEPEPAAAPLSLETLFLEARTHYAWRPDPVTDDEIHRLYALTRMGPTSANSSPGRFLFLRTPEAKERLRPALSAGNIAPTLAAPCTVIVAYDPRFFDKLPTLYPTTDARSWFANNDPLATATAFRNGTLQGAYLLMAARAIGLDCAPMSGFDNSKVDSEFLTWRGWKSNFLLNLGHGDPTELPPRPPRLDFDDACAIL